MDKNSIYKKIKEIAYQLDKEQSAYSRADLAYELQIKDSLAISELAWEAYSFYQSDKTIKKAFLDNEGKQNIISEYELYHLMDCDDKDKLFPLLNKKLSDLNQSLQTVDSEVAATLKGQIIVGSSKLMSRIVGTSGATKVKEEASLALTGYTQMVDSYSQLRSDIQSVIADFVFLRGEIEKVYRQYAMTLIDTFGDSIKSIAPKMFDFESIEWLDVSKMLKEIQLEYKTIYDNCEILISDIGQNFGTALKSASNSYKSSGDKTAGLILAGINMFSHYVDASQKTNELKSQLLILKDKMKRDATHIKGDVGRLLIIHKQINDLYIPKANAFYRYNGQVLSNEYKLLIDTLYKDPEILQLKQKRDAILSDYKMLQQNIVDNRMNINYYSNHINECNETLSKLDQQYKDAKNSKPSKPFFLFNWFTFGALKRSYNRNIFEWNQVCSPVIHEYESLQINVKMDMDDLKLQQDELKDNESQSKEIKIDLDRLSKEISSKIEVDVKLKEEMATHLEPIIRLLWIAKDIMNSKLDQKLLHTVEINEPKTGQLPKEIETNIVSFTNGLKQIATVNDDIAKKSVQFTQDITSDHQCKIQENNQDKKLSEEDVTNLTSAENEALHKSFDLLSQWTLLKTKQVNSELVGIEYDKQLKVLQTSFREAMAKIDEKSTILSEVLKKINTAKDHEELKNGLLQLADKEQSLTKEDLDEFLSGKKTIEL